MDDDAIFKALGDPTRRELLDRLFSNTGQTLAELCRGLSATRQGVTKHLKILERAGLVAVRWQGREKRHYLNPVPIQSIAERWIHKFQVRRASAIAALKAALEE